LALADADVWTPVTFSREEFARTRFDYKPGQHVVFAGPTQRAGKTTLAFQLLQFTATPDCPAYVAVSKPDDPVTREWAARLHYRIVETWPVERKVSELWDGKPSGYVIWPRFGDIDLDAPNAEKVIGALLRDRYAQGVKKEKGIVVVDDTVTKSQLLRLDRYMKTHIAMAGAMKLGGWYFYQKPTDSGPTSLWAFENAYHKFTAGGYGTDRRNRDRYDEIGGFDRGIVKTALLRLRPYQFLYTNMNGEMCIVDSK
jgi:hypothetical protein